VSLPDDAVATTKARFIIEQGLIHRRVMSGVWVLGEGPATPSPLAKVSGERCKYS